MVEPGELSFPDGPRTELDAALAGLVVNAERVLSAQGRLRALLHASQAVVELVDLPAVLERIAESAAQLVDAEYGAIGVVSPDGGSLDEFVSVGMDAGDAERIGHPPTGRGLLGALIADPAPIVLDEISADERASGFPEHHPAMHSFLGVPVRIRGKVYGNLYLANSRSGSFTDEDEQLVEALAGTAGYAIENARLLAEARLRGRWMSAAAELSADILTTPSESALDLVVTRVREVSGAPLVCIGLVTDEDGLRIAAVSSEGAGPRPGDHVELEATFAGEVARGSRGRTVSGAEPSPGDPLRLRAPSGCGPALAVPLRSHARLWGVLVLARATGDHAFPAHYLETTGDLGSRAAIAIELAHAREQQQQALLMEDRRRIARDLHEHVIQQLFATGLGIQAVAGGLASDQDSARLDETVTQLDEAISQIRTAVFALSHRHEDSLRHRVLDVVAELSAGSQPSPTVRFIGPVDHAIVGDLDADVLAVTRELLTNAVKHAAAGRLALEVSADDEWIRVRVEDDGRGIGEADRRSGLRNLAERAQRRSGDLAIDSTGGGTSVQWRIPVARTDGERR